MSSLIDLRGDANLNTLNLSNHVYVRDRFNQPDLAMAISQGFLELPGDDYLTNDSTITAWLYLDRMPNNSEITCILTFKKGSICLYTIDFVVFIGLDQYSTFSSIQRQFTTSIQASVKLEQSAIKWFHIAFMRKDGMMLFYVNGQEMIARNDTGLTLNYQPRQVVFDEVKIFSRAVNPRDIKMEYEWTPKSNDDNQV